MQKHKAWLSFALEDLKSANIILNNSEPVVSAILYHAQQCAEKSLKSYLVYRKQEIQRTHDLVALVNSCSDFDKDFHQLLDDAIKLNPFVTKCRYPDSKFVMPDLTTAQICVKMANKIFIFTKEKTNITEF